MTGDGRTLLDWAWAGSALEAESGDLHVVAEFPGGVLVAVIDGLGHGVEAAASANAAAGILAAAAGAPLETLMERCHEALRRARGAVMSLARFEGPSMTWAGVGNVEGVLLRGEGGRARREAIPLRGGILGYQLPSVRAATVPIAPGDTLILATDGIRSGFGDGLPARATPRALADGILARHARGSDDALVLVARWLGAVGGLAPGAEGARG